MTEDKDRLEINWTNALGGALAAVSSAVLLSTLGTAGTLIGAAVGSLVITIGGAVYAHSMRVAQQRLRARQMALAHRRLSGATDTRPVITDDEESAEEQAPSRWAQWRETAKDLPWKRIAVLSAALFVVAMGIILAFELATGHPVSRYTGGSSDSDSGTSVPGLGGDTSRDQAPDTTNQPEPSSTPQDGTTEGPAGEVPAPAEETPPPTEEDTGQATPTDEVTPTPLVPEETSSP